MRNYFLSSLLLNWSVWPASGWSIILYFLCTYPATLSHTFLEVRNSLCYIRETITFSILNIYSSESCLFYINLADLQNYIYLPSIISKYREYKFVWSTHMVWAWGSLMRYAIQMNYHFKRFVRTLYCKCNYRFCDEFKKSGHD